MEMFAEEVFRDDYTLEAENRIKNLTWTVCGDYTLNVKADIEAYKVSKSIALYDAVKNGAFAFFFDSGEFSMYLIKKLYLQAQPQALAEVASLCTESASYKKVVRQRAGVDKMRTDALNDISELYFDKLSRSLMGRAKLTLIRYYLTGVYSAEKTIKNIVEPIIALEDTDDTFEVIKTIDMLYNTYVDKDFERLHGSLENVLNVSIEELKNSEWLDYLNDEAYDTLEEASAKITQAAMSLADASENKKRTQADKSVVYLDEAAIAKMDKYIETTFGKSCLSEAENKKLNHAACKGIHANCSLHTTEGILSSVPPSNYRYKYAQKNTYKNRMIYYDNHRIVKRNILLLTDTLRKVLVMRAQTDTIRSDTGSIAARRLWKVNRTGAEKLFDKTIKGEQTDFVVDILIDSSGSQSSRQGKVALQAYIISEALSNVKIPHRITGFCTFWEYTVLNRFRNYDDDRKQNSKIFEYMTSSNNRDGLAVKAISYDLMKRNEEKKILIVLSDGRPNDVNVAKAGRKVPAVYTGNEAVADTAHEIRRARSNGISVLGVFAGTPDDLQAEKKIFGSDFAYIRNIADFSNMVGVYLKKQIENE